MSVIDVRNDVTEEISTILAASFGIEVTQTSAVPHSDDVAITFPNLDTRTQRCKVIQTAVLYVDIRRSTNLNLEHRAPTVAKLYSAFVRAMTRCAEEYGGHIRGIIGDRVMVLFNPSTAFEDAVKTAVLINSTCKHVLNKYFVQNEISCGIGIDYGRMLVTKTGVRRHGNERHNYRSLVWLGRPANVASKLTDLANKTTNYSRDIVREATNVPVFGGLPNALAIGVLGQPQNPFAAVLSNQLPIQTQVVWNDVEIKDFLGRLKPNYLSPTLTHDNPGFSTFFISTKSWSIAIPPILMTQSVYDGLRKVNPKSDLLKEGYWKTISVSVPGYTGRVIGGDIFYPAFK